MFLTRPRTARNRSFRPIFEMEEMIKKFKSMAMSHETEVLVFDLHIEEERHDRLTWIETLTNN